MSKKLPSPIFTLKCEKYTPYCLKFYLDGEILYVGTLSGEILVWNLESNRLKNEIKVGTVCIMNLELLTKQNHLVSQDKVGEIKCWQIDGIELKLYHTFSTQIIGFCKFALYKTNMLLCKGEKSTMNCYSTDSYSKITDFNPHQDNSLGDLMTVKCIGDYIFCGYEANIVVVWQEDHIINQCSFPELECLMALDVDHNMTKGICAGSSNVINTFCITDGNLSINKNIKITNPGVNVLQLRPDDKIVAAACWDLTVRLFSWKTMKLLAVLDSHSSGVLNIAYSELSVTFWKAKYLLAIANKDNKITLWDVYNGKDKD
ncbi:guanine nucleotide-binding protein subunit beta-like protein 1 [Melanaphis sacchari]|uniref:Guanine nucleotide-binding protein subunit beta-like protein 1 n=1 Tax=Melanaphis sacchari TaxID=742174 RepID=A0A2H8TV18_9HEMI|nr:guanine nucleotide-binding protein subunit beta-like protein 1 [Melanaphis sacchari]